MVTAATKWEDVCFLAGKQGQTSTVCWMADITLPTKVHIAKAMVFPVVMCCESWTVKKHRGTDAFQLLEKTLESPLDGKEIKSVNLKGNQPWILIGRTDAEVETPIFWSSDANSWLIRKVPDAGKDWGQKKKRASEDEMAGWHHWCNGNKPGQTLGDGEGQRGLVCCSPWGHRVRHNWVAEQQQFIKYFLKQFINDDQVNFVSGMQGWFNIQISISAIQHVNKAKKKEHNYLNRPRKTSRKLFIIKDLRALGAEEKWHSCGNCVTASTTPLTPHPHCPPQNNNPDLPSWLSTHRRIFQNRESWRRYLWSYV